MEYRYRPIAALGLLPEMDMTRMKNLIRACLFAVTTQLVPLALIQQVWAANPYSVQQNTKQEFVTELKEAVIAARQFPKLEPAGQEGTPVVSFDYLNGVISNIRLEKTCGVRGLDRAALAAVEHAAHPNMPSVLKDLTLHVVIPVPFAFRKD